MDKVRAFLGKDDHATARCPMCGQPVRFTHVSRLPGVDARPLVECPCGARFRVFLDRRRFLRRAVHERGLLYRRDAAPGGEPIPVVITSISVGGMRFELDRDLALGVDEVVRIEYGRAEIRIHASVVVIRVVGRTVLARVPPHGDRAP